MAPAKILCYGDSNTAGYFQRGSQFHPYAKMLSKELQAAGFSADVKHCGLSGLTAEELVPKIRAPRIMDVCQHPGSGLQYLLKQMKPVDLVIIMLGTNDIGKGTDAKRTMNYVRQLNSVCHEMNVPTFLLGPPTIASGPVRFTRDQLAKMLESYARVTPDVIGYTDAEKHVPRHLFDSDGLHFSPQGAAGLAKALAPMVIKALNSAGAKKQKFFEVGQELEYFNGSEWVNCKVTTVNRNGGITVDAVPNKQISPEEQATKIRLRGALSVGDAVEYFSTSANAWVPAKVVKTEGYKISLDVKAGVWLTAEEQKTKIRASAPPAASVEAEPATAVAAVTIAGARFVVGQHLQYYSSTVPGWIGCVVLGVDAATGNVQVDVRPHHWFTPEEQTGKIRAPPATGAHIYDAGDRVEYSMDHGHHWVACRVNSVGKDGSLMLGTKPPVKVPAAVVKQKVRRVEGKATRTVHEAVEYFSARYNTWLPCTVTKVSPDGSIEVSVKEGYAISKEEQHQKVRSPAPAAAPEGKIRVGQALEYNSKSAGGWIACVCTKVGADGSIQLDVKPDFDFTPEAIAEKIRVPGSLEIEVKREPLVVGQTVEVLVGEAWVKTTVIAVEADGGVRLENEPDKVLAVEEQNEVTRLPRDEFVHYS